MLQALTQLPEAQFALAGGGPHQAALERQAAGLRVRNRRHWLGSLTPADLSRFHSQIDVLVPPSLITPTWKEQFGRVIVEAQACERPVVGSDSGAIPEVIGPGGRVFPEGDADALARTLADLRADPDARRALGAAGRRHALDRYTPARLAEQMLDAWLDVMAASSA